VTELDRTWAESQIEAMADGSLSDDARRRMQAMMDRDPALAASVERAAALMQQLKGLKTRAPVPRGLGLRLWNMPAAEAKSRRSMLWMPAGVLATAVMVTLGASLLLQAPAPDQAERVAAVQDFTIAMAYLQKSTLMAQNQVNEAVGSSVLSALAVSRGLLNGTDVPEGDRDNED